MTILFFLVPVIIWIIFAKIWLKHAFSVKELAAQTVFSVLVLAGLFWISDRVQTGSTKLLNGEVTETRPVKKTCPFGWVTFTDSHCTNYISRSVKVGESCSVDEKGRRSCTDIMQTQYYYIYRWERRYFVDSDLDHTFEIRRTDRQGVSVPPRFAEIKIGDAVSLEVFYRNYIRAAVNSLFKADEVQKLEISYPEVFDYYHVNRVIYDGVTAKDAKLWNAQISEINRDIRETGANVILVLTKQDASYAERLAFTWGGHNINDLVITVGVGPDEESISWVDVRSWSGQSLVNVRLRDAIQEIGTIDPARINAAITEVVRSDYRLQDMEAFAYLKDDISLPVTTIILALLMILVFTPLITFYFARHVDWR